MIFQAFNKGPFDNMVRFNREVNKFIARNKSKGLIVVDKQEKINQCDAGGEHCQITILLWMNTPEKVGFE